MLMTCQVSEGQDRSQGRSMVMSRNGIVAAESPLVVEPMMNGIGGDLFAIVYDAKSNKLYGLNASGWAPKGLTIEYLQKQGIRSMPQQGVNAITVPGAVDGWQKLADKFGRKKLAEDLAAAIRTAQDGYPVPEWTAAYWASEVDYLRTDETAAKTYLPGDRAPKVGEVFRNPELAWSLEQIAQYGREAFYKGEIAAKILDSMKRHNGPMTAQDLAEYSSEFVEPISATYRDWTIYELPPNVLRAAAQRAGHRGTGDAEHHGDISFGAEGLGLRLYQGPARHDGGKEAGIRGSCEIHRRPEETEIAGCDAAFEGVGCAKGQVD